MPRKLNNLAETRRLERLLGLGIARLEEINDLINKGAAVDEAALFLYIRAIRSKALRIDENIVRLLAISGAKVNYKIRGLLAEKPSLLQYSCAQILSPDGRVVDEKKLVIAISLIKNGANYLDLDLKHKVALVKAILKSSDPWQIRELTRKGFISPNFKIEGKGLVEYAKSQIKDPNLNKDVVGYLERQPRNLNPITAAKIKFLLNPLTIQGRSAQKAEVEGKLMQMSDGATIKKNSATFRIIAEDGRNKIFLEKKSNSVESKFGSDIFRILARKRYAAKRELLAVNEASGEIDSVIKWDDSLARNWFLKEDSSQDIFEATVSGDEKFIKNYAYMCGVLHVLGEPDRNGTNFLVSSKTGLPVHIDASPLVNNYPGLNEFYQDAYDEGANYGLRPFERFAVYGSAQSAEFLKKYLVAPQDRRPISNKTLENLEKAWNNKQDLEDFNNALMFDFNDGINDSLFAKIKENIERPGNAHLKASFLEFVAGVKAAIDLAQDQDFLEAYTLKYQIELGDGAFMLADQCRRILQENAECAKSQFKEFIKYYDEQKSATASLDTRLERQQLEVAFGRSIEHLEEGEKISVIEEIKRGTIESLDDLLHLLNLADSQNNQEDSLKILEALILYCDDQGIVEGFCQSAIEQDPTFKDRALIAPISLFANHDYQEKATYIIWFLQRQGCEISRTYLDGIYGLFYCKSSIERLKLLKLFEDQSTLEEAAHALFEAVYNNNADELREIIVYLKERQIKFDSFLDKTGFDPIETAIFLDRLDLLKILLSELEKTKIDVARYLNCAKDSDGMSLLIIAASCDQSCDVVNFFLEKGYYDLNNFEYYFLADNVASDIVKSTAEFYRLIAKDISLVTASKIEELRARGANLNAAAGYEIFAPKPSQPLFDIYFANLLKAQIKPDKKTIVEVLKLFKESGVDLGAKDKKFLQQAIDAKNHDLVLALVENGVVVDGPQKAYFVGTAASFPQKPEDASTGKWPVVGVAKPLTKVTQVLIPRKIEVAISKAQKTLGIEATELEKFKKDFLTACNKVCDQANVSDLSSKTFDNYNFLTKNEEKAFAATCLSHENMGRFWQTNNKINKFALNEYKSDAIKKAVVESFKRDFSIWAQQSQDSQTIPSSSISVRTPGAVSFDSGVGGQSNSSHA